MVEVPSPASTRGGRYKPLNFSFRCLKKTSLFIKNVTTIALRHNTFIFIFDKPNSNRMVIYTHNTFKYLYQLATKREGTGSQFVRVGPTL